MSIATVAQSPTPEKPLTDEPPDPNRTQRRQWPKRRMWLDRIALDKRLTSGTKGWLLLLAQRSSDDGKPVWGNQRKMGRAIGRCDRSVRRYRAEAEQLGYIVTYRSPAYRDPVTGQWGRRKSNCHYLRIPSRDLDSLKAPRRRQRAGWCVVPRDHSCRSDPADNTRHSSPLGVCQPAHPPLNSKEAELPKAPELYEIPRTREEIAEILAKCRATLPKSPPPGLRQRR